METKIMTDADCRKLELFPKLVKALSTLHELGHELYMECYDFDYLLEPLGKATIILAEAAELDGKP
jgi:hypothetical protein